ncbi:MAG: carboxypeptidase-like regulatory domain-containing protein [Pseudomonadota bacterium]
MRSLPIWLSLALLALPPALAAAAAAASAAAPAEADTVVLEVRLGRHLLSEAVNAYQYPHGVFLPLGEMARLLTIAVKTEAGAGRAGGFLLNEQRTFHLDVLRREVIIDGRREAFDRSMVKLEADDIYVASTLLARWLPVDLALDLSSLSVIVTPRETLPLQAGLDRQQRGKRAGPANAGDNGGRNYARVSTPYAIGGVPFVDQTLAVDLLRSPTHRQSDARYTAYLTSDLLGAQADLFASRSLRNGDGGTLRLTVGRHDPDAGLLGPLHARSVQAGSVQVPGIDNISHSSSVGNGAAISNRPLDQPTRFDRHSLRGDLPPGWDVELYYNNALAGFQQSRADGKYSFDDQPLAYGPNDFRLVFHGPLGQLRVERRSFLLEGTAVPPGSVFYDVSAHRDIAGHTRSAARFDWGVARFLSASAALTRAPAGGTERLFTHLGLHSYWQTFILSGEAARGADGGNLGQLTLKTQLAGLALSARRVRLNGFTSEAFPASVDPVRTRDELRVDGAIDAAWLPVLPLSLQVRRDTLASRAQKTEVQARVALYSGATTLSNSVRWQSLAGERAADGMLQLSRRVAGLGISGQLQYTVMPHHALSTLALTVDHKLYDGYLVNLAAVRSFEDGQYRVTGALNKSLGSYGLGLSAFYSSRHEFGAGFQLFFALGREPRQGRWMADAQPMAYSGSASIRVFLDKNLNGVMDDGDEAIKGAGFTVNGGNHLARTDAAGIAYLNRLPANANVDLAVDPGTLEDPQWVARTPGVRLVPRPGKVAQVDFAVSITGEIDGTAYWRVGGARRGIGDLLIELVDADRKVAASVRSTSDGYYVLPYVLPGRYLLRISPEQLKRLKLADSAMHVLTMTPQGDTLSGRDFVIESAAE